MSDAVKCDYCPHTQEVNLGKDASIFLMAVVTVPGRVPVVVTTPKFCSQLPDNHTACDVCKAVSDLTARALHGAVDLAAEIQRNFTPKLPEECP